MILIGPRILARWDTGTVYISCHSWLRTAIQLIDIRCTSLNEYFIKCLSVQIAT